MFSRRKRLRSLFLVILGVFVIVEIVVFSPSPLEDTKSPYGASNIAVDPEAFIQHHEVTLATGVPLNKIPEYSIHQFRYVSIHNGEKQWRLESDIANMYNPERLMHSRTVKAFLFDPDDQVTVVTGSEAKYYLNQRDLEVFGNVHTVFPDGFEVVSEYLRYKPAQKHILIPTKYPVHGDSHEPNGQNFQFVSQGLDYVMGESKITLPQAAKVTLQRPDAHSTDSPGVPNLTQIESDRCFIFRDRKFAQFMMNPQRPLKTRFVHITQPTLFTRSRRADLHYGDFSQVLQYLVAYEDVLVKETSAQTTGSPKAVLKNEDEAKDDPNTLRYATGGRADFDTRRDVIVLTEFPQAYQNQDTVTGDVILMHRDSDIIEIEHSNAFSGGPNE